MARDRYGSVLPVPQCCPCRRHDLHDVDLLRGWALRHVSDVLYMGQLYDDVFLKGEPWLN